METLEIIIYIVIALMVGSLLLVFIGNWNVQDTFGSMRRIFSPSPDTKYTSIAASELPRAAFEFWELCGLGSTSMNKTVYVKDAVPLNKTAIFDQVKQANLCRTLQWNTSGCGTRDDVRFNGTQGPAVLVMRCDASTRQLIISS